MSFQSEHVAIQPVTFTFKTHARTHPAGWPDGVDSLGVTRGDGKFETQAVVFDANAWTPEASRAWLKCMGFTQSGFAAASKTRASAPTDEPTRLDLQGVAETDDGKLLKIRMSVVKADAYKKQIFGWLYICTDCTGKQVVDHSGEVVSVGTLEAASYKYVASHRKMGDMHGRTKDGAVVESGHLIECVMFTQEKREAMAKSLGHPATALNGLLPDGMWVGYQVTDAATFADVLSGGKMSLSFGGRARRVPVKE